MSAHQETHKLKQFFAERTKTKAEDWFPVFRARMGMQIVFEVLLEVKGTGDVITQLFTCATVPASVTASGMRPIYGDILQETLAIDPEGLPISNQTRAVIYQHTFGIFDEQRERSLAAIARKHDILVMEDSAHCVGKLSLDDMGYPLADVSVHSIGIEKIASALFGGMIWVNPNMQDRELREKIVSSLAQLPLPSKHIEAAVSSYSVRLRILSHLPAVIRKPLRASWVRKTRFLPGVTDQELEGKAALEPMATGEMVASLDLAELADLDQNEAQRLEAAKLYTKAFTQTNAALSIPAQVVNNPQPFLWYPIVVEDTNLADDVLAAVNSLGYYCSSWGRPVLYAGVPDPLPFGFDGTLDAWPQTMRCSQGIIPLPTSKTPQQIDEIINTVLERISSRKD